MTHEVEHEYTLADEWDKLGNAEDIPAELLDVPIGDLDPDEEIEAMVAYDRSGQ